MFAEVGGHGKVIEKTLPGQSLECRGVLGIVPFGGAEGIRTPDLLRAREALSLLSYSPMIIKTGDYALNFSIAERGGQLESSRTAIQEKATMFICPPDFLDDIML